MLGHELLAFRSQARGGYESDRWRLLVLDRATGRTTNLTENLDRWVGSVTWSPDSTRLFFTVEDPAVFTTPWSATVTYERVSPLPNGVSSTSEWDEQVCAENLNKFGTEKDPEVPTAEKPDF